MLAWPTNVLPATNFFIERKSLQEHMNACDSMPGILYKCENQNIQAFF